MTTIRIGSEVYEVDDKVGRLIRMLYKELEYVYTGASLSLGCGDPDEYILYNHVTFSPGEISSPHING